MRHKGDQLGFDFGFSEHRGLDTLGEPALAVRRFVPAIHRVKQVIGLMHHQHGAFRYDRQVGLGDDHCYFDDAFFFGVEAGHFHIQPN